MYSDEEDKDVDYSDEEEEDDYGDEEDYGDGDEVKLEGAYKDIERTGKRQELGEFMMTMLTGGGNLAQIQKRLMMEVMTDTQRFQHVINNYSKFIFNIPDRERDSNVKQLERVTETLAEISDIKHKNPIAFLIAYYCSESKGNLIINMKKVEGMLEICEENSGLQNVLEKEDVIRYARLIHRLRKI